MAAHDEQVEKVARAIYDAEPTIRVQVRVPRTTADFTSSLEIRNVPWSALDECDPHEKSAMVTSRNLARAAIAALGDGWPSISPELIDKLSKLANYLTEQGEYEACDLIDTVVERLTPPPGAKP